MNMEETLQHDWIQYVDPNKRFLGKDDMDIHHIQ